MSHFDIDESIDVDISDSIETTSLDSSIDVMDSVDIPEDSFDGVSLDETSLENYEGFSESDNSDFSEVNDIMNKVELEDLEFDENVNDISNESFDVLEDVNAEELELTEDILEEAEFTEEIEQTEENEISEEPELAEEMLEQTEENTELPEQNDALSNMRDYMYAHNYGKEDFGEYSQDPEWQALNKKLQEANGIEVIESGEEILEQSEKIEPIENLDNWLKDINPNFDEFDIESPYCNNCGSCAYAVYQRLEGNNEICATAENIGYNSEMEVLTGMEQVSMSPQEIEQRLLDAGDGAHAIIGIDRAEGPGHWFNAACINGKVVAIDGQDGSINEWPPDYGNVVNWEMSVRKETT